MSRFTKGPWTERYSLENKRAQPRLIVEAGSQRGRVCTVTARIEMEDNARLIVAAPDLLEALGLLFAEVRESGNATAKDFGWSVAVTAAKDALAKAEGK